mmetsp:Transcript_24824/g.44174  ORF Transcript_24824/g.44174 Transcript_24824/m.44174 type:complete len:302 (-) Transcript_24824:112-1017(-)
MDVFSDGSLQEMEGLRNKFADYTRQIEDAKSDMILFTFEDLPFTVLNGIILTSGGIEYAIVFVSFIFSVFFLGSKSNSFHRYGRTQKKLNKIKSEGNIYGIEFHQSKVSQQNLEAMNKMMLNRRSSVSLGGSSGPGFVEIRDARAVANEDSRVDLNAGNIKNIGIGDIVQVKDSNTTGEVKGVAISMKFIYTVETKDRSMQMADSASKLRLLNKSETKDSAKLAFNPMHYLQAALESNHNAPTTECKLFLPGDRIVLPGRSRARVLQVDLKSDGVFLEIQHQNRSRGIIKLIDNDEKTHAL